MSALRPAPLHHVFGPAPSRRLGRSLGVDLVPFKTCPYDCIYCQLGPTTCQTVARREYVPLDAVVREVRQRLAQAPALDYVTLSGSGEPTLHSRIGEVIAAIKRMTAAPVAVLTNGALLGDPEVQQSLREADVILPSLDAGDPWLFDYVNRPHSSITFEEMAEGLVRFREQSRAPMWLEVLLLDGASSVEPEARKIAQWVRRIAPERVHLNTVTRPPAVDFALPVPEETLRRLAALFGPTTEIVADFCAPPLPPESSEDREAVFALLRRRPCTAEDVAGGLRLRVTEAAKLLDSLVASGSVCERRQGRRCYYACASGVGNP